MEFLNCRSSATSECPTATSATVSLNVRPRPPPFLTPTVLAVWALARRLGARLNLDYCLSLASYLNNVA
jgi:hypothetical protein